MNQNASLVEVLQALAAEMAKASSEADAEVGLKQLRQIRADFLKQEDGNGEVNAARRNAEALIAWLEAKLEQLKLQLARKRHAQEGAVMEQLAQHREAEEPSLLPTELVDAVVHATDSKDPEEITSTAPVDEAPKEEKASAEKNSPEKKKKKTSDGAPELSTFAQAKPESSTPVPTKQESSTPVPTKQEPSTSIPTKQEPSTPVPTKQEPSTPIPTKLKSAETKPAQRKPIVEKPEFTKYELLVAHLAASVGENPNYFEKLRKNAKRKGPMQKAPEEDRAAVVHYRTVHDLGKHLVNLELYAKAIAKAKSDKAPISALVNAAARELKGFLRDFKAAKEKFPEMAGDYERRFGGWTAQFASLKPEKGGAILDQCRAERQPQKPARETVVERETDALQYVLKKDDYWKP